MVRILGYELKVSRVPSGERKKRSRIYTLGLVGLVCAILVSSFVAADVILSYQAKTGPGANVTTPFYFQDGADYASASATGFITIVCGGSLPATDSVCGGANPAPGQSTETITLDGVNAVNAYVVDVSEYDVAQNFPTGGGTFTLSTVTGSVGTAWATVTCAYAFISTVAPTLPATLSASGPSGQAAGCNVFEPTVASGDMEDLNLVTGAATNPAGCAGQAGITYIGGGCATTTFYNAHASFGAVTQLLYFSFAIVVSGAGPTGSTTLLISPTFT